MNKKSIILVFSIILIIILIVGMISVSLVKKKVNQSLDSEFVPQEEISEEQQRQTIVSLYFIDKETNEIKPEARLINAIDLLNNPYENLINLLIQGPKNDKLKALIPSDTRVLDINIEKGVITINFSNELLKYEGNKELTIKTIVNTLTELKEVEKVIIKIEGQNNPEFEGEFYRG